MRLTKPLFWLVALLWLVASLWWYASYSNCSSCAVATAPASASLSVTLPTFSVSDGPWQTSPYDHLRFGKSNSLPLVSNRISLALDSIANYANANLKKTVTVTGYYNDSETNTTSFENLGLARANELKKILINKGLSGDKIETRSELSADLTFVPADTLVGGISMIINTLKDDLFQPHSVYFNTAQNTLPVDTSFTNYIRKVKLYLQRNADKKLLITGHTDNVGNENSNLALSANRAAFVKNELAKQGIELSKMESSGKGMSEPIASNETEDGRAKNRRVTIQLQQ